MKKLVKLFTFTLCMAFLITSVPSYKASVVKPVNTITPVGHFSGSQPIVR